MPVKSATYEEKTLAKNKLKREMADLKDWERRKDSREQHTARAMRFRVAQYGDKAILPRSMKVRRTIARKRAVFSHADNWGGTANDTFSLSAS